MTNFPLPLLCHRSELLSSQEASQNNTDNMKVNGVLRFVFSGYSIWLEPEQFHSDLDSAIQLSSKELDAYPIPAPHVTLMYGIAPDLSEKEMIHRFQSVFSNEVRAWPPLRHKGFLSDVEIEGVNGGLMDMAWMEVSYETSEEHEALIDRVRGCFDILDGTEEEAPSSIARVPWAPHASLAYTDPESHISLELLKDLVERYPTLKRSRRIVGVSLWSTQGTIDQWRCLDTIRFEDYERKERIF